MSEMNKAKAALKARSENEEQGYRAGGAYRSLLCRGLRAAKGTNGQCLKGRRALLGPLRDHRRAVEAQIMIQADLKWMGRRETKMEKVGGREREVLVRLSE